MNTIVIFMLKLIKQDLFFHRHDFRRISNKYSRYLFYFKQSHDVQSVTNRILYFVPQKKKKKGFNFESSSASKDSNYFHHDVSFCFNLESCFKVYDEDLQYLLCWLSCVPADALLTYLVSGSILKLVGLLATDTRWTFGADLQMKNWIS